MHGLVALGVGAGRKVSVSCNLVVSDSPEVIEMTPKPCGSERGAFNELVSLVALLMWVQVCGMHLCLFLQACRDGSTAPAPVQGLLDSKQKCFFSHFFGTDGCFCSSGALSSLDG